MKSRGVMGAKKIFWFFKFFVTKLEEMKKDIIQTNFFNFMMLQKLETKSFQHKGGRMLETRLY